MTGYSPYNSNYYSQAQQPQIQQTFQIAPNQNSIGLDAKEAQSIEEVNRLLVWRPTLFVNNDYSCLWIKDANGTIRTFKTEEIIPVNESVEEINNLKQELADIKKLLLEKEEKKTKKVGD